MNRQSDAERIKRSILIHSNDCMDVYLDLDNFKKEVRRPLLLCLLLLVVSLGTILIPGCAHLNSKAADCHKIRIVNKRNDTIVYRIQQINHTFNRIGPVTRATGEVQAGKEGGVCFNPNTFYVVWERVRPVEWLGKTETFKLIKDVTILVE